MTSTKENSGLAALFANSSGPRQKPQRADKVAKVAEVTEDKMEVEEDEEEEDDDEEEEEEDEEESEEEEEEVEPVKKSKKSKKDESADLEDQYMAKLAEEVADEEPMVAEVEDEIEEDESDSEDEPELDVDEETKKKLEATNKELDKADYTIFVGNVSSEVITDKKVYTNFKALFSAIGTVASVRFRSIAFSKLLPRKVAFISQQFHSKRDTVNAYIVFKNVKSVKGALTLNGSVFKGFHMRVDSVAHPGAQDHKRCVFVGALDFEEQEEALWEAFSSCGEVEYVRIVRDAKTNVGKGFAYVQFKDVNSVEQALLLNGKGINELSKSTTNKRKLRVSRAKSQHSQDRAKQADMKNIRNARTDGLSRDEKSHFGRAQSRLGKAGKAQLQDIVQEGLRAKKDDGKVNLARSKRRGVKAGGSKNRVEKPGQSRAEKRKAMFGTPTSGAPGGPAKKKRLTTRSQKFKQDGGVKKDTDGKKDGKKDTKKDFKKGPKKN
ncbi:Nucleolar protein 12 [Yarrowia sp. C11]|nr:Nucleolar protein 12 [Yarrowia sp. C11]